jgi:hypothetical protein
MSVFSLVRNVGQRLRQQHLSSGQAGEKTNDVFFKILFDPFPF